MDAQVPRAWQQSVAFRHFINITAPGLPYLKLSPDTNHGSKRLISALYLTLLSVLSCSFLLFENSWNFIPLLQNFSRQVTYNAKLRWWSFLSISTPNNSFFLRLLDEMNQNYHWKVWVCPPGIEPVVMFCWLGGRDEPLGTAMTFWVWVFKYQKLEYIGLSVRRTPLTI